MMTRRPIKPPAAIPAMAPRDSLGPPVVAGLLVVLGIALELDDVKVALELDDVKVNDAVLLDDVCEVVICDVEAVLVGKPVAAAAFCNFAGTRSLGAQPLGLHGLLLQHPRNGGSAVRHV
jgi:hypothetical protein